MPDKKILEGVIEKNEETACNVFKMIIVVKDENFQVKPGQFVNLYLDDKSRLLPRPISICNWENGNLTLIYGVVGKGTEEMSMYKKGQSLRLSSANGNGFDTSVIKNDSNVFLVGGGIGVPPLLLLAKELRKYESEKNIKINIVGIFGFKDESFLKDELKKYCQEVYIATDSGSEGFHGNVTELIKAKGLIADYGFACGPKPMLKSIADILPNVQVSMEERMGCGYGACVGCTCKTKLEDKISLKKVCTDGPVFIGSEVAWNE